MAKRAKTAGINLPVPQSREAAIAAIAAIGADQRALALIETDMSAKLAAIKEAAEKEADPLKERIKANVEGLKVWAEANRDALTNGGKVKSADLGAGKIGWRQQPASVTLRGVEEIIKRIKTLGFAAKFLRTKEEVDKEAMLKEQALAKTIAGVSIGSAGEAFFVEPFGAELAPADTTKAEAA